MTVQRLGHIVAAMNQPARLSVEERARCARVDACQQNDRRQAKKKANRHRDNITRSLKATSKMRVTPRVRVSNRGRYPNPTHARENERRARQMTRGVL